MRCIEIYFRTNYSAVYQLINRNMRCIEISIAQDTMKYNVRLIETWDVLKYCNSFESKSGKID